MPLVRVKYKMNAKNAKTAFTFNVFLASIAGEPLGIKYKQIANILNVSESTISKLRHGHLRKMPPGLQPEITASHFAAEITKGFAPTRSTIMRFTLYAQILNVKYIVSESLVGFSAMFRSDEPYNEQRASKIYADMIPELIQRCYEEAYFNSERDCASWLETHKTEQSEIIYQKMCDAINQDVLDTDKLRHLLSVVYTASLRHQLEHHIGDVTFLNMLDDFICSQVNHPYYNSVRRTEIISLSKDSSKIKRTIRAQEQIVPQTLNVLRFTLSQTYYHAVDMTPEEIVQSAFSNLICTVNSVPLVRYVNLHEHDEYTIPQQLVTVTMTQDQISGMTSTELLFAFNLYPQEPGDLFNVVYEYSCTAPFIRNISCNYSYTLHYPCKFLDHEFVLDSQTRQNWGVRVKLFTPMTNSECVLKRVDNQYAKNSGTADSQNVTFYDWAMPGCGYYRNIYELKYTDSKYERYLN